MSKLQAALSPIKTEIHRQFIGARMATIDAVRFGTPIRFVCDDLRNSVLGGVRSIAEVVMANRGLAVQGVFGYESGAFSKGTCIIGSDFDMNVCYYEEGQSRDYRTFEAILRSTVAEVFGAERISIHNAGQLFTMSFLRNREVKEYGRMTSSLPFLKRKIRSGIDYTFRRPNVLRRLSPRIRLFLYQLDVASSPRSPELLERGDRLMIDGIIKGISCGFTVLDREFIFGDEGLYVSSIENARCNNLLNPNYPASQILANILSDYPDKRERSVQELESVFYRAKYGTGYANALRFLDIIKMMAEGRLPFGRTYGSLIDSRDQVAFFLGARETESLFESIDYLLKVRSSIAIFSSGGVGHPSLRTKGKPDYSNASSQILDLFALSTIGQLADNVEDARQVIRRIISGARN